MYLHLALLTVFEFSYLKIFLILVSTIVNYTYPPFLAFFVI